MLLLKSVAPEIPIKIFTTITNGTTHFKTETEYFEELTNAETQVLKLLANGKKRKEIATQLCMSERTVSNHLQRIFDKLRVSSAVEAMTKAIQMGYLTIILKSKVKAGTHIAFSVCRGNTPNPH